MGLSHQPAPEPISQRQNRHTLALLAHVLLQRLQDARQAMLLRSQQRVIFTSHVVFKNVLYSRHDVLDMAKLRLRAYMGWKSVE